jgi:uncharacterized protein (TIGR02246 family)
MKSLLFLITACLVYTISDAQAPRDKEEITKVINSFQDDFNNGSFKNAASYTSTDWVHINPLGGIDKGRDNVLKTVRDVHQSFLKGVTMKIESMEIRFVTAGVAIADVIHQVDNYTTPDGVQHNGERHIKSYVLVKQKGKWLLTQDHNTIIQNRP